MAANPTTTLTIEHGTASIKPEVAALIDAEDSSAAGSLVALSSTLPILRSEDKAANGLAVSGNINISGDTMAKATADLPEEQRNLIRWYFGHAHLEGWSLKDAAERLRVDSTTLYRIWHGKYEASPAKVCERIASYKRLADERANVKRHEFVDTSISRVIWRACNYALVTQSVALIYGESQIGKTTACEEYARRNNHGQTKLVRMPAAGGVQMMMREIAKSCFVSPKSCYDGLRERVLSALDGSNLLIIDEVHQAFLSYQTGSAIKCLEVLREIHDRTKCGMVLVGTKVWKTELRSGGLSKMLEQLRRRGAIEKELPDVVPDKDVVAIAKAFGLGAPDSESMGHVRLILRDWGLGRFTKYMQAGARAAAKSGKPMTWDHFVEAYEDLSSER